MNKKSEKGQIFVLLVLMIIGLLAIVGLAVDSARIFIERRRVQNAVDNAALAGSLEYCIGGTKTSATAKARAVLTSYGYGSSGTIGYTDSDPSTDDDYVISVDLSTTIDPILIQIIYTGDVGASARAAAFCKMEQATVFNHAAYSLPGCSGDTISITGSAVKIGGGFHSNGDAKVNAGGAGAQITGSSSYSGGFSSNNATYTDSSPTSSSVQNPPLPYSLANFTGSAVNTSPSPDTVTDSYGDTRNYYDVSHLGPNKATYAEMQNAGYIDGSGNILPGVYYMDTEFDLNGPIYGYATFVAGGDIKFKGTGGDLKPYYDNLLLAYSNNGGGNCNNDGISFSGSSNVFEGMLYAPYGTVSMSGASNGVTIEGLIVAMKIKIAGSSNTINYNPIYEPPPAPTVEIAE